MDHVLWLARIFGPFFFIVGLWMVFRTDDLQKVWNSFKNNPGIYSLTGMLNLIVGLAILATYNSWSCGLPVLLTLAGWLVLIRGVLTLFIPETMLALSDRLLPMHKTLAIIPLLLGILISYLAFA